MPDYENIAKCWRRNKAALTRAKKKTPADVIAVCEQAFADFDSYGWPDNWSLFQRAFDDAQFALAYNINPRY